MSCTNRGATGCEERPLSVLVVSPVRVVACGIAELLTRRKDVCVVGCAVAWDEARDCLARARPNIILIDGASMRVLRFVRSMRQVRSAVVVAFGVPQDAGIIAECARAGVHAFCDERCDERELAATINDIMNGELALPPTTAALMFRRLGSANYTAQIPERRPLTQREADVLAHMQTGASNKEIAARLGVSVATVKNHVHSILQKLGVRRRAAAIGVVNGTAREGVPRGSSTRGVAAGTRAR